MIDLLYRHVLIPAFETGLKRRRTFAYWRELEESQWLTVEALKARQLESLQKLLTHAADHCPYYRQDWRLRDLHTRKIQSLEDFRHWPLINRETVRTERINMRAAVAELRLIRKATGGSSGVPLEFDLDPESNDRRMGAWHRGYGWGGAAPGTRQWYLWGAAPGSPSRLKRAKDALYHRLYRRRMANSFEMRDERIPWYVDQLKRARPKCIVAYTNPLYHFARALAERKLRPYSPASIIVGAEKLHDFQRELIERVFQAPVFETYGSREFMLIGGECERHAGLHLTMENLLVEVVDDDGRPTPAGREGNVAVTDLTNYGMPFIRYLNGDRAVAGFQQCSCGRGLSLLASVTGRQLDMLETPDGRKIPGEFFPHLIKEFPSIRRFQVVQSERHEIELLLVVNKLWNESDRQSLEMPIRAVIGPDVHFNIALVDDIPLTGAGKLQVVVRRGPGQSHRPQGTPVSLAPPVDERSLISFHAHSVSGE
jgi:phenylacetate-CoA ligase